MRHLHLALIQLNRLTVHLPSGPFFSPFLSSLSFTLPWGLHAPSGLVNSFKRIYTAHVLSFSVVESDTVILHSKYP
ncbi:hypothetical protein BDR06DRAFT_142980 [Suillus hirtellus]|nr:hypothetical protein BDR06DRAFT_142980 [Suillus hirtellus]